ncbi:MAG: AAA family ATPase [Fusobacteriaceae bacterium]
MKLIYFWVGKYKGLKNFKLNLDSNYEIEIENIEKENPIVNIKKHKIPNIFGDSILGITALVGKNGSGKSNVLEFLSIEKNILETKFVYIYSTDNEDEYLIETNFLDLDKIKGHTHYKSEVLKKYVYKYNCKNQTRVILDAGKENVRIIRYKPDLIKRNQNKSSISKIPKYNVSLDINYMESFKMFQKKENILKEYQNVFLKILLKENVRQYDLNYKNLNLLESLEVKEILKKVTKKETEYIKVEGNKNRFIDNYLVYNININFKEIVSEYLKISSEEVLKELSLNPISKDEAFNENGLEALRKILKSENYENEKEEILKKTWSFLEKIKCLKGDMSEEYYIKTIKNNSEKIDEFLRKIEKLDERFFDDENTLIFNFINDYTKDEEDQILDILKFESELPDVHSENYEMLERVSNLFYNRLEGLSDGERMYISILSSIVEFVTLEGAVEKQNLILLLDEVELYLHPEWMRRILSTYINYLSRMKDYKFQLIFATHNPFIISDLPKENVILLEKGDEGSVSKKCEINTFGANIFDLYKETFFLNSTFGEFATIKISEILDMKEITKEDEEIINYILNSIGEKLIKNELEAILKKKKRV